MKGLDFLINIVVFILSFWIFVKTLSYGVFEIKQNSNTIGGILTIVFAVITLILPNVVIYINGSY